MFLAWNFSSDATEGKKIQSFYQQVKITILIILFYSYFDSCKQSKIKTNSNTLLVPEHNKWWQIY